MTDKMFGPKPLPDHPQVTLKLEFEVDELLAPIIEKLWSLGLMTQYSCQDNMGSSYILFPMELDARIFAKVLHDNGLKYYLSPRKIEFGGGASVHFTYHEIPQILEKLQKSIIKSDILPYFRKELIDFPFNTRETAQIRYKVKL